MTALRLVQTVLTLLFLAIFAVNLLLWIPVRRASPLIEVPSNVLPRVIVYACGILGPCLFLGGKAFDNEVVTSLGLDLANLCFIAMNLIGLRSRRGRS